MANRKTNAHEVYCKYEIKKYHMIRPTVKNNNKTKIGVTRYTSLELKNSFNKLLTTI